MSNTPVSSSPKLAPFMRAFEPPRLEAPSPREAYLLARNLDRQRPPQTEVGHRIYWMTRGSFGSCEITAGRLSSLVVGSHPLCDVRLFEDPSVELRHLLIRSSALDDGCPILSVVDLHTARGFLLSNGACERAIDATGVIVLRVGAYAIVALPSGAPLAEDMPEPVCRAAAESPYRIAAIPSELYAMKIDRGSRITLLPRVIDFADSRMPTAGEEAYDIAMTSHAGARLLRVAGADLRKGILVGRSLNCDPLLRAIVDGGTSRGHLLLMKDRAGAVAYDMSSTQGTYFAGRRMRAIELADSGTVMTLGTTNRISLVWRRSGA